MYENAREHYVTFITPECKQAIDSYIDMRSRYGEKINDDSYLIREQFDIRDKFAISNSKDICRATLQWKLRDIARRSNVRSTQIPIAHGFRYFWMKQAVNSKINPEIREMLLGHKIGLASAYYRPTEEEMYAEYEKAIDALTIEPSKRLERKVEKLQVERTEIQALALEFEKVKQKIGI